MPELSGFIQQLVTDARLAEPFGNLQGKVQRIKMHPGGQLHLLVSVPDRLSAATLCALEAVLEKTLDVSEVIICQKPAAAAAEPADSTAEEPESNAEYLAGLADWLLRHLWHQNAYMAGILRQGRFKARKNIVVIELPQECCEEDNQDLLERLSTLGKLATGSETEFSLEPVSIDLIATARAAAAEQTRDTAALRKSEQAAFSENGNASANGGAVSNGSGNGNGNSSGSGSSSGNGSASRNEAYGRNNNVRNNNSRSSEGRTYRRPPSQAGDIWGRLNPALSLSKIADVTSESGIVSLKGEILGMETRLISDGYRLLVKFDLTDYSNTIQCIIFAKPEDQTVFCDELMGRTVTVQAEVRVDARYSGELQALVQGISAAQKPRGRSDEAATKRVELHCHTKMSARDAVCDAAQIISTAAGFGHAAVAITDHGVVQSFPEARKAALAAARKGNPIKVIYGMEGYLVDDGPTVAYNCEGVNLDNGFIALDVETTGLDCATERLIEIAAVHFVPLTGQAAECEAAGGCDSLASIPTAERRAGRFRIAAAWQTFVDPGVTLSTRTTELTGITSEMVAGAPDNLTALRQLQEFLADLPVVAHNALFDLNFLRSEGFRTEHENDPRLHFNPPLIDTLPLARHLHPDLRNHKLPTVAAACCVEPGCHHRALDDALTCGRIFASLLEQVIEQNREKAIAEVSADNEGISATATGAADNEGISTAATGAADNDAEAISENGDEAGCDNCLPALNDLNNLVGHLTAEQIVENKRKVYHIIILVQNPLGLYHLYKLVSESHTQYFHRRPRIPKSLLTYLRSGLLLGSACEQGEVFQAVVQLYRQAGNHLDQAQNALGAGELQKLARYYDYLEIQPLTNNHFMLLDEESGMQLPTDLENLNKLVVSLGERNRKPVCATCDVHFLEPRDEVYRRILQADMDFKDADRQAELYFRTTDEMLGAFSYLGETKAEEVVIEAPRRIADRIEADLKPFPDGSFPPVIPEAADQVRAIVSQKANELYGRNDKLPTVVQERLDKELSSIIDNGFAIMYYIAHHLVKKSNEDGYIVGSRGSVGSSLAATFCGITEVNPLPPHYVCPGCHFSEFMSSGSYGSGYDLPQRNCPECGTALLREGQDIPFETFLGFDGDKQPDIDLNFSGDYQPLAHRFIEEMFGSSHTFRAGTISSFADKNAAAMVKKYFEAKEERVTQAEIGRLARGVVGVKRTTGQHPGGIVVVPKELEIYDFTPIQHPADKKNSAIITTHFDFNSMHDTILKLDILGHDDPTMLKVLGDMTGIDVNTIPIPDEAVMSLFQSTEALGIPEGMSPAKTGTLGLPELGTFMARDMIRETKPTRFFDLVQLMGLSHGTDVWKGNAQELIRSGVCTVDEVIGCRDSIMTYLIHNQLPAKAAFDIMERVRKGRGLLPDQEALMQECDVPAWYIDSCKKIKYMFPKAHAAAYTISSLRIAWFKVNYPVAYYCAYFTVRADEFDSTLMIRGLPVVRRERERLQSNFRDVSDREQKIFYILEIVEEMYLRGISFLPLDLMESDAYRFLPAGEKLIRPPLSSVPGISRTLAANIVEARNAGHFKSRDELGNRAGIGSGALETLAETGCLDGLPQSAQIDLFEYMSL